MTGIAWETRQLLFVYGSLLLPTGEARVDAAMASGIPLGEASMPGMLYDLGDYPGAVAAAPASRGTGSAGAATEATGAGPGAPVIRGRLVGFQDPNPAFAALDWYEGHGPDAPHEGEFVRTRTEVILEATGERLTAQVYLYALPVAGREAIPSGDYLAFRRSRTGAPP